MMTAPERFKLAARFQVAGGIEAITEFQLYLNREKFEQKGITPAAAEEYIAGLATSFPGIAAILPQQTPASASSCHSR